MQENKLLLRAVAGSRLYGYATAQSDFDYYEVYEYGWAAKAPKTATLKTRQTIVDGIDVTQVSLSHFIDLARDGSHQALDAMFQAHPEVDLISELRAGWRVGFNIVPAYERIISKFALQEGFRKQRHALRAALNLADMLEGGRYAPELSQERIELIAEVAPLGAKEFRKELHRISPVDIRHLL